MYRQKRSISPPLNPPVGGLAIPGPLLRKLVKIHAHYEQRGERIGGIATQSLDGEMFEATVTDGARTFHLKLHLSEHGVHEHGREEDL